MSWDFTTEPEFQQKLDRAAEFVRTEVSRLDLLWPNDSYLPTTDTTPGRLPNSASPPRHSIH